MKFDWEDKIFKGKGFFESLTEPQKEAALNYKGPENHGDSKYLLKKEKDDAKSTLNTRIDYKFGRTIC